MRVPLGVWRFIPSHSSHTPKSMKCDSHSSILAHTFASPCLGHKPKCTVVIIGLFETTKTIGQALPINLNELLDSYGLRRKIITYIKYEGAILNFMTITFKFIVNCEILGLEEIFNGICLVMHLKKCGNMLLLKRYAKILV
jgi:hypothetical protein